MQKQYNIKWKQKLWCCVLVASILRKTLRFAYDDVALDDGQYYNIIATVQPFNHLLLKCLMYL